MKGSRLYSILKEKCPVCQEGEVFMFPQKYNYKKFDKMHTNCSVCGHKYEKESGFWYGAMYVSYGLTVAFSSATFVLTYLIYPEASVWIYISAIIAVLILMVPITFRMSRMVWMNLFTHYNPSKAKKHG